MKRLFAMLLTLLLLFGLFAGCNSPQEPTPSETEAPATESAEPSTEPAPAEDEYTLEHEDGCNQLTFYWHGSGSVDYDTCDMWIWYPNADGRGYLFHPCSYGAKVVLNVPEEVAEVGFIVRTNCSDPGGTSWGDAVKDFDGDRFAQITGPDTAIYLKPGEETQYFSDDGGITLYQSKEFTMAGIIAMDQIKYNIKPALKITSLDQVQVLDGDRALEIKDLSSLGNEVVTGVITLGEQLDLSKTYTVKIEGYEAKIAMPTQVFDSAEFISQLCYDGDDLGAVVSDGSTTFKVWAPTASEVDLALYEAGDGGDAFEVYTMEKADKGVWQITVPYGHGTYYTYLVTTAAGMQEAVDPYAKAVGVNGNRGMVIDLSKTDPAGFANDKFYDGIDAYNDAVIWEVHVRDFSNQIAGAKYPGKYLGFTEKGLKNASGEIAGLDYLVDLGVTHVHLQPVYDYATVDETKLDTPQFNWGYDPKNYNVPEGSYSTDPYHGEVRVNEFKQMVQALHESGMAVVMDVVYNHTFSDDSCFGRIVPYYYYRYNTNGSLSNGSGCGNETASDRVMFRKYMVDSVSYWAKEYHVDGFRFDLMALHDVDTMQAIEEAVHKINPKAIIYGEGWTGGTTPLRENLQANQKNIGKVESTGIGPVAVFNDAIRDGLKGSVFDAKDQGYINGKANSATAEKVIFGLEGGQQHAGVGWSVADNAVINYMACHDNNTLWDKLLASNGSESDDDRLIMNRLGISILMVGKGVPFFLAGEEMLRTKNGDHNSYKSSDAVNNIDWDALTQGSDVMLMRDFYRALIAMRKANSFLTEAELHCEVQENNCILMTWTQGGKTVATALINPNAEAVDFELPEGNWGVLVDGWDVAETPFVSVFGTQKVKAKAILLAIPA